MTIYVVEKRGVYGQGVVGADTSLAEAMQIAEKASVGEDGYHDFTVWEVQGELVSERAVLKAKYRDTPYIWHGDTNAP